jgi:hypothetical protein
MNNFVLIVTLLALFNNRLKNYMQTCQKKRTVHEQLCNFIDIEDEFHLTIAYLSSIIELGSNIKYIKLV